MTPEVYTFFQSCLHAFGFEKNILTLVSHGFDGFGLGSVVALAKVDLCSKFSCCLKVGSSPAFEVSATAKTTKSLRQYL